MNPSGNPPPSTPTDPDLADQAHPGHGVPSQDPDEGAQFPLPSEDVEDEANSKLIAGGAVAAMATGAAIGAAVGGPVGVVVGASAGAVAAAIGGVAATAVASIGDSTNADTETADNVHLHTHDSGGDGRPVVLIHGWPLSAEAWAPQMAVLQAAGYRVVTYDRRGFGRSDKPESDYSYDTLADDLKSVIEHKDLQNVTLVGFSMGGGEVARYIARHGETRLHSVVFAAAVPPYLLQTEDNPDGPLTAENAEEQRLLLEQDRDAFFDHFTRDFFSAHGVLQVSESQREDAVALCHQSAQHAALACMESFGTTDFREDLQKVRVPTLVIHGDADDIVPLEGSGRRTHEAIPHSKLVIVNGAPHGLNVSHLQEFNDALLAFLRE